MEEEERGLKEGEVFGVEERIELDEELLAEVAL